MLFGTPSPEEHPTSGSLYNENVQCKNVLYAMLFWLQSEKARKGIWGRISDTYWNYNGTRVLRRVREWAKDNKLLECYDPKQVDPKLQVPGRGGNLVRMLEVCLGSRGIGEGSSRYR